MKGAAYNCDNSGKMYKLVIHFFSFLFKICNVFFLCVCIFYVFNFAKVY